MGKANPAPTASELEEYNNRVQPFVKWAGGKRNLLPEIDKYLPKEFNDYYEPFLGGGAVYFHIYRNLKRKAFLSDINDELIHAYQSIKRNPEGIIKFLKIHRRNHGHDYYYKIRGQTELVDSVKIAARFVYLNKTCYNGLYRVNKNGEFNVPIGRYKNPGIVREENLRQVHMALRKATIALQNYAKIKPKYGDFVYFDPPFHSKNGNGFTSYTSADFSEVDQRELRNFALELDNKNVKVMLSNSNTNFIRNLYRSWPFRVNVVHAPRLVNGNVKKRNSVEEVIITNY